MKRQIPKNIFSKEHFITIIATLITFFGNNNKLYLKEQASKIDREIHKR